jgi:hypothetical protein
MQLLSGQVNRKKFRAALVILPKTRDDLYLTVMERITSQDEVRQTIAVTALTWITYAKSRLNIDQLLHAIAVNLDPEIEDIEPDDLIDVELLLSSCLGLVILNKEDRIVRLVHYTVQDYLEKKFPKLDANTSIAKTSMTYLDLAVDLPSTSKERMEYNVSESYLYREFMTEKLHVLDRKYTLAAYAARCLGVHVREGNEKALTRNVLDFLSSQAKRDLNTYFTYFLEQMAFGFTQLHFLSMFGLSYVCRAYLIEDMPPGSLSATR